MQHLHGELRLAGQATFFRRERKGGRGVDPLGEGRPLQVNARYGCLGHDWRQPKPLHERVDGELWILGDSL